MAVVADVLPQADEHERPARRLRPVVLLQCLGALMAITGMAVALYFGVAPIRVTVRQQVPVEQASGERGAGLTVTGRTQTATVRVTCVPYLQFDSSAHQDPVCEAKVHRGLGVAFAGLVLFVAGSALWVGSHGDRAVGLSERRPFINNSQA